MNPNPQQVTLTASPIKFKDRDPLRYYLLRGPIPADELEDQEVVSDYQDGLLPEEPETTSRWIRDLWEQSQDESKVLVPMWWDSSPQEFLDRFNESYPNCVEDVEKGIPNLPVTSNEMLVRAGRRVYQERGQPLPDNPLTLMNAGESLLKQLRALELLLHIALEVHSRRESQSTDIQALS